MTTAAPRRRRSLHTLFIALVALCLMAVGVAMTPTEAQACGGFFCSQSNPVDQAGEQILFAVDGTSVTAYVQVQYQGNADEFSWVLPLPAVPEFSVGTDTLFSILRAQTDPRFEIEWQASAACQPFQNCGGFLDASSDGVGSTGNEGPPRQDGGVEVLAEGAVGPFDYKVIQSDDANDVFNWLNDNGYDQPASAQGLIERYTMENHVFVALKLLNDASVSEIQPIVLKYDQPLIAGIPLRLTSIAATEDMPIRSWVLANARAIPMNYFHVLLNANAFDWFRCAAPTGNGAPWGWWWGGDGVDCQQAYMDLVTRATDVVNGHGFVTEYGGKTAVMDDMLYVDGRFDLGVLRMQTSASSFIQEMLNQGFPRNGLVQELIRTHIPKPDASTLPQDCKEDSSFYAVWNLETCLQYMPEGWTFDAEAFALDLDERIIAPLQEAQALFNDHPYMTRLFTTMSPSEMDRDPLFSFNPSLPDVSNVHRAMATPICTADSNQNLSSVLLTYPDGTSTFVGGTVDRDYCTFIPNDRPVSSALAQVQILNEDGAPESVDASDAEALAESDERLGSRVPNLARSGVAQTTGSTIGDNTGTFGTPAAGPSADAGGCACAVSSSGSDSDGLPLGGGLLVLGLVGAVGAARRRVRD